MLPEEIKDKVLDYSGVLYSASSDGSYNGSCFVVSVDPVKGTATLVTNEHVTRELGKIGAFQAQLRDAATNEPFDASIVSVDPSHKNDLALVTVQLPKDRLPGVATFAPAHAGDEIYSVGQAGKDSFVSLSQGSIVVTMGGTDGVVHRPDSPSKGGYNIFVNAPAKHGMSGGPTVNAKGDVVAVNGLGEDILGIDRTSLPFPKGMDHADYSVSISVDRLAKTFPELAGRINVEPPAAGVSVAPAAVISPAPDKSKALPFSETVTDSVKALGLEGSFPSHLSKAAPLSSHIAASPKGISR